MRTLTWISLVSLALSGVPRLHCQQPAAAQGEAAATSGMLVEITPMLRARAAHTATALQDGRVLIAGGLEGETSAPHDAERYDPTTNTFAPTGPMVTPRHSHTATLLTDGTVLIAGGYDANGNYLSSTERYDPATDTFRPAGTLITARAGHEAVRLQNGDVLLVGGVGAGWTFLSSAEVYRPATQISTPTGSMGVARESHVAVLLDGGDVLVVGGHRGRRDDIELFTSAERYNPETGNFRPSGDMTVRRHKHDAVRLPDGRVLITGGTDERDDRGRYTSTEMFDPATDVFSPAGALRLARYKHAGTSLVLPDGHVLIAGGAPRAEVYNPQTGTFTLAGGDARMPGQFSASALLPDGRVLITGGYGGGEGPQPGAWLYGP